MKQTKLPPKPTKRQLTAAMRWADPSSDTLAADMHMIQTYPLSSSVVSLSAGRILRAHMLHCRHDAKRTDTRVKASQIITHLTKPHKTGLKSIS